MFTLDWDSILAARGIIGAGIVVTLQVTLVAIIGGIAGGTILAILAVSGRRPLQLFSKFYVALFRAVPLVMLLLWFFLIVPQVLRAVFGLSPSVDIRLVSAMVAFVLLESAFFAEIIRAGIIGLSKGQFHAAASLGMSRYQSMRYIILPQAFRAMLPIMITQCIVIFQDTSLVYVISLGDFFRNTVSIGERDGTLVPMLLLAGAAYWAICSGLSGLVRLLQNRAAA